MRRLSAQYIITGTGDILKRGIIATDTEGRITEITDTGGRPVELSKTEFYNGILVPGFVNCHCHIELSGLHKKAGEHMGLGEFIRKVRETRTRERKDELKSIAEADKMMFKSGISACGDVCNTGISFEIKEGSPVKYINFLEVFGIDPRKAGKRISEVKALKKEAGRFSADSWIVPHSFYSMSATLLAMVKEVSSDNELNTVHFMESEQETSLLKDAGGGLMESYGAMGISPGMLYDRVPDHITGIMDYISPAGNLILVHNTFAGEKEIRAAVQRGNCFFCLCPGSNLYIENALPPVTALMKMKADIVIGTDSLASNKSLDILGEMKIINSNFPDLSLEEMVGWATINGARALKIDSDYGSIEKGKKPGLVLIENADLSKLRLTEKSRARRLV
ncbi:MAG: amidohydrolase family protein [Bacteroidales bacterium]|nr:amidohydrolase family protein [Bacteroidales bacterium]